MQNYLGGSKSCSLSRLSNILGSTPVDCWSCTRSSVKDCNRNYFLWHLRFDISVILQFTLIPKYTWLPVLATRLKITVLEDLTKTLPTSFCAVKNTGSLCHGFPVALRSEIWTTRMHLETEPHLTNSIIHNQQNQFTTVFLTRSYLYSPIPVTMPTLGFSSQVPFRSLPTVAVSNALSRCTTSMLESTSPSEKCAKMIPSLPSSSYVLRLDTVRIKNKTQR